MPRIRPCFRFYLPLIVLAFAVYEGLRLALGGDDVVASSLWTLVGSSSDGVPGPVTVPKASKIGDDGTRSVKWAKGREHRWKLGRRNGGRLKDGRGAWSSPNRKILADDEMTDIETTLSGTEETERRARIAKVEAQLDELDVPVLAQPRKPKPKPGSRPKRPMRKSRLTKDVLKEKGVGVRTDPDRDHVEDGRKHPRPKEDGAQKVVLVDKKGSIKPSSGTSSPDSGKPKDKGRKSRLRKPAEVVSRELPPPSDSKRTCTFPKVAVALKSGRGVAHRRLPWVLSTYASQLCNLMLFSDANGELNGTQLAPEFEGRVSIVEAQGEPQSLLGTGKQDFEVTMDDRSFRVYDVVGNLYSQNPETENDPDADPALTKELNILNRDRWQRDVWDVATKKAEEEGIKFATRRHEDRRKERIKKEEEAKLNGTTDGRKRRRLHKRGDGGDWAGWSTDNEKNIPGYMELWNRFPDAEWYLMVDDDTYPFIPALYIYLSAFYKFDDPHYIGKAFLFTGCHFEFRADDPHKEIDFASGGAGIVMSRGALMASLPYAQLGIEKTKGCWAGDARVAIWAYDPGIRLEWPWEIGGRMHVGPQAAWHSFGRACDLALTYHLVPPAMFPKLWEIQRSPESGGGFVTNADLFQLFFDGQADDLKELEGGFEMDTNHGGMDFLELSRTAPGVEEKDFDAEAVADLDKLMKGEKSLPAHTDKLLQQLEALKEKMDKSEDVRRRTALALRCLEACHTLVEPTAAPEALRGVNNPVKIFHGRTAKPQSPMGNMSPIFGPCIMWNINSGGGCFLKSGFTQAQIGGAPGHISGIVDGALDRYRNTGKDSAAGKRCGWDVGRKEKWDEI